MGYNKGKMKMFLNDWCPVRIIMHEFLHSLGVGHEHNRPDRDNYISIHWNNIIDDVHSAFKKADASKVMTIGAYDFKSLMHYFKHAFSKNKKPTITSVCVCFAKVIMIEFLLNLMHLLCSDMVKNLV